MVLIRSGSYLKVGRYKELLLFSYRYYFILWQNVFWFWLHRRRAAYLGDAPINSVFLSKMQHLFEGGAYSSKYGIIPWNFVCYLETITETIRPRVGSVKVLTVDRSDFHLSSLGRILIFFPCIPVDTISKWWMWTIVIKTIQVWMMATIVPPGSSVGHSAVVWVGIMILVSSAKRLVSMPR